MNNVFSSDYIKKDNESLNRNKNELGKTNNMINSKNDL
jgi:hypothetical protein